MGFDLLIHVQYNLCPETGKPYYYAKKTFEKVYDLPEIIIPEDLRPYLVGRGKIFHAYIQEFKISDLFETDAQSFLHYYPLWNEVLKSDWYDETWEGIWDEKDHNAFRELLVHLVNDYTCGFTLSWSY
jgi:hypothetical protein